MGAELAGELFAEFLVLDAESGDLAAVGTQLLAQRVAGDPFGDWDVGGRLEVCRSWSVWRRSWSWR